MKLYNIHMKLLSDRGLKKLLILYTCVASCYTIFQDYKTSYTPTKLYLTSKVIISVKNCTNNLLKTRCNTKIHIQAVIASVTLTRTTESLLLASFSIITTSSESVSRTPFVFLPFFTQSLQCTSSQDEPELDESDSDSDSDPLVE